MPETEEMVKDEQKQLVAFAEAVRRCDFTYRLRLDNVAQQSPYRDAEAKVALMAEGLVLEECLAIVEGRAIIAFGGKEQTTVDAILTEWRKLLIVAGAR